MSLDGVPSRWLLGEAATTSELWAMTVRRPPWSCAVSRTQSAELSQPSSVSRTESAQRAQPGKKFRGRLDPGQTALDRHQDDFRKTRFAVSFDRPDGLIRVGRQPDLDGPAQGCRVAADVVTMPVEDGGDARQFIDVGSETGGDPDIGPFCDNAQSVAFAAAADPQLRTPALHRLGI